MGTFADAMKSVERARKNYVNAVEKVLTTHATAMQWEARQDHRYRHRTYNLRNSTRCKVTKDDRYIILRFWIDPERVTVNGWNYGWIQNDGSLRGYRQGKISPPATPTDRVRRGVAHDDFMGRVWEKHLPKIMKGLKDASKRLGNVQ